VPFVYREPDVASVPYVGLAIVLVLDAESFDVRGARSV
jgi:hypothetical protein